MHDHVYNTRAERAPLVTQLPVRDIITLSLITQWHIDVGNLILIAAAAESDIKSNIDLELCTRTPSSCLASASKRYVRAHHDAGPATNLKVTVSPQLQKSGPPAGLPGSRQ